MKKTIFFVLALFILCFPAFTRMLRSGIYSMQDFHYFRLIEFHKCVADGQIPCRWAADAGLGYGEPLFNFYGQLPYLIGEAIHTIGVSHLDALKLTFILSIVGSAGAMFLLSKKLWKNNFAALISAVLYTYAPYRAVDIWVRGALPEALSFVFFPLILLFLENYFEKPNMKNATLVGVSAALLVLTHNLSVLLFLPFLVVWGIYRLHSSKFKYIRGILVSLGIAFILSAFYILPVLAESKFVDIASTTLGYFNFRGHFTTSSQLLFSNYWGYGGSTFGTEDGFNLSIGYLQWILPIIILLMLLRQKAILKYKQFLIFFLLGWGFVFLTHERATTIWVMLQDVIKYLQFPWRFLGMAVLCFSLASGALVVILKKQQALVTAFVVAVVMLLYAPFFREDIWFEVNDQDLQTGELWTGQMSASIGDYWPKAGGIIPMYPAPTKTDDFELLEKTSNKAVYKILSKKQDINFPTNPFPGWERTTSGENVIFTFTDTPVRKIGNIISIVGVFVVIFLLIKKIRYEV